MSSPMMTVSKGFKLVYIGVIITIIAVVGGFLGMCFAGGAAAAAAPGAGGGGRGMGVAMGAVGLMLIVSVMMIVVLLVGSITGLVGRFFCLAVPERIVGARPLIMISVCLEVISMGMSVFDHADNLGGNRFIPPSIKIVASAAGSLLPLISAILFLLFTRTVAVYVRRYDLAEKAMLVLKLWGATVACCILGFVIMLMAGAMALGMGLGGGGGRGVGGGFAVGGCFALIIFLIGGVIGLLALIQYVALLRGMTDATARHARKKQRASRRQYDDDDDDDDDDDYDRRGSRSRGSSKYDDDDDDDDDDDRGGRSRRPSRQDDDDDDDRRGGGARGRRRSEDDDDDNPRGRYWKPDR